MKLIYGTAGGAHMALYICVGTGGNRCYTEYSRPSLLEIRIFLTFHLKVSLIPLISNPQVFLLISRVLKL